MEKPEDLGERKFVEGYFHNIISPYHRALYAWIRIPQTSDEKFALKNTIVMTMYSESDIAPAQPSGRRANPG